MIAKNGYFSDLKNDKPALFEEITVIYPNWDS